MSSEIRTAGPTTPERRLLAGRALAALDGAVALASAACLLYLAAGGYDLGFVSVRRFSKPFLVLLVLAALRAAIPRPSWLSRWLRDAAGRVRDRAMTLGQRTPWAAAAFDSLVAVLTVHFCPRAPRFSPASSSRRPVHGPSRCRSSRRRSPRPSPRGTRAGTSTSPSAATTGIRRGRAASRSFPCTRC